MYLCYDTALNEEYTLIKLMQKYPDYISLFKGTDDEDIWDAAPYLFQVSDNFYEMRTDWLIQLDHCILFETKETKEEVCRFLHYYMYKKSGDKTAYVRIWDARVWIKHLPAWEERERVKFFNFFKTVYTEQENEAWLDKWQLGRFDKPVAVPILKTELLPTWESEASGSISKPPVITGAGAVDELVKTETPIEGAENQPPKRRRFFIE